MARPFVFIGSAMFISLFVFSYCGVYAAAAVFGIAAVLFVILLFFQKRNQAVKCVLICCAALMISSSLFSLKMHYDYRPAAMLCDNETHTVTGVLEKYETDYGRYFYTLKHVRIDGREVKAKISVNSAVFRFADIDDELTFSGVSLYKLGATQQSSLNHMANGVYIGAYSTGDFIIRKAQAHSVFYYLDVVRKYIAARLSANMDDTYAAVSNALLTGDKTGLDYDTELNFRYSGVSHLFAVSGFHLTLWTFMIGAAFSRFSKKYRNAGNFLILLFIVFFMALTGFSKSVVRAGMMLIISVLSRFTKYKADTLNSLFIAVSVILAANPFAAGSISLQLSFLSTLGIITLSKPVSEPLLKMTEKIKHKSPKRTVSMLYTIVLFSVISVLFTMPVTAFSFGYYSAAAPLANLLCMLPAQALIALSGLGVLMSPVKSIAKLVFLVCGLLTKYIVVMTDKISHMHYVTIDCTSLLMSVSMSIILAVFFILLLVFSNKNKMLRCIVASAAAAIAVLSCISTAMRAKEIKITVADVGNGISVVYRQGDTNMIIGCGGSSYREYRLGNICDSINTRKFSLILIPDTTETLSYYAYDMVNRYAFENAIVPQENLPAYFSSVLPENAVSTNQCEYLLDEKTTLVYINNEKLSGARIISGDFSCVIFFSPAVDTDVIPGDWLSGDLLITRKTLPGMNISGFKNILVSTDAGVIFDNANIYSTNVGGNLTYTFSDSGRASVKEEKHDYQ